MFRRNERGQVTMETLIASGAALITVVGGIGWPVYWMGRMEARMDATDRKIETAVEVVKEKTTAVQAQVTVIQNILIEKGLGHDGK